jgi:drug/metabolite transporter (DMT)-like permease
VLVAALIFAVAALLVKLTAGRVPVLEITLLRSGISLVVSLGESAAGRQGGGVYRQTACTSGVCALQRACSNACAPALPEHARRMAHRWCHAASAAAAAAAAAGRHAPGLLRLRRVQHVFGQRRNVVWLIPRGVFGATAMTSFYAAILLLPLGDGMCLFFFHPCLTAVAAWAIRGEALGLLGAAGVVVSLVGTVVVIHPPMLFGGHAAWGPARIAGTGFGLVSAVCCAGAFICIRCGRCALNAARGVQGAPRMGALHDSAAARRGDPCQHTHTHTHLCSSHTTRTHSRRTRARFIGKSEPALVVALYFHLSTALMSAVPLACSWPQAPVPLSWHDAGLLLGVAAGSFAGQLFMTRGLQLEHASLMSSLNFSQVCGKE